MMKLEKAHTETGKYLNVGFHLKEMKIVCAWRIVRREVRY